MLYELFKVSGMLGGRGALNVSFLFPNECTDVQTGLLSLALFAVLESVCQGVQCHVSISLLAVVSHQSDPHHLMKREVESTVHQSRR